MLSSSTKCHGARAGRSIPRGFGAAPSESQSHGRTTAACHGASGGATRRHDETTTRRFPPMTGPTGKHEAGTKRHEGNQPRRTAGGKFVGPSSKQSRISPATLSTALPRCRRAGRQAGVAGVRIESSQAAGRRGAACDSTRLSLLLPRGARRRQRTGTRRSDSRGFLRGSSCSSCFFVRRRVVVSSCRDGVSSTASAAFLDKRLPAEVTRP